MSGIKNFSKSAVIYLIGSMLTKLAAFFMLPVYTKYLPPTEYGYFDLYTAYVTFLCSIVFIDVWGAVMRFMFDYDSDKEKAKPVTVGALIFFTASLLYTVGVLVLGTIFHIPYKGLLMVYGLSMSVAQFVGYVARAQGKNVGFALGGFLGTVTTIFLNVVFVALLHKGYEYLYIAYCLGNVVNIMIVGRNVRLMSFIHPKFFDKNILKEMLRFSLPLPINSAAYWFLTSYNRVVISERLSASENGLYAVANKFGSMVSLVTQCFQMAWQELSFSKAGSSREEMERFYTTAFNEYLRFVWLGTLIIIPCVKIIFPVMVAHEYGMAASVVPGSLLAALFTSLSSFLASIISTLKRNNLIFTTTCFGALINVALLNLLVSVIGINAANIALGTGFGCVCVMRVFLIRRYIRFVPDFKWIVPLILGTCAVYFIYIYADRTENAILAVAMMGVVMMVYRKRLYGIFNKAIGSRNENEA